MGLQRSLAEEVERMRTTGGPSTASKGMHALKAEGGKGAQNLKLYFLLRLCCFSPGRAVAVFGGLAGVEGHG